MRNIKQVTSIEDSKPLSLWEKVVMPDGVKGMFADRSYVPTDNFFSIICKKPEGDFVLRRYTPQNKAYEFVRERKLTQKEIKLFYDLLGIKLSERLN